MSEFTYQLPNEEKFLAFIIRYMTDKNNNTITNHDVEIAGLLNGARCHFESTGQFTRRRWNECDCKFIISLTYDGYMALSQSMGDIMRLTEIANQLLPSSCGYYLHISVELQIEDLNTLDVKDITDLVTTPLPPPTDTELAKEKLIFDAFMEQMHPKIINYCMRYYEMGDYFHAVLEASKLYVNTVKGMSGSEQDGFPLMADAFKIKHPLLKVSCCISESEKSYQEGFMHLSMGLVNAFRHPLAHESHRDWDISKDKCIDILHFISYMLKELDNAKIE